MLVLFRPPVCARFLMQLPLQLQLPWQLQLSRRLCRESVAVQKHY